MLSASLPGEDARLSTTYYISRFSVRMKVAGGYICVLENMRVPRPG